MADIISELDNLFGLSDYPRDETGCLRSTMQLLHGVDVSLLVLAGSTGLPIAVEDAGTKEDSDALLRLTGQICEHLADKPICTFEYKTADSRPHTAFGVRLSGETTDGVLGGLLASCEFTAQEIERLYPTLMACGSLVWFGIHTSKHAREQARRIEHLRAEQDTLKHAHAHTVATVIEEREERIRQQRDYVIHLEAEVDKRSSALRTAMQEAQQANESKSEFLTNMSHEIRTPLTAILGYADVLSETGNLGDAPSLRVEAIDAIRRNGRHLLELINDILDLAKVEAGKLVVEHVALSTAAFLSDMVKLVRERAEAKGLTLLIEYDGPIPATICIDPTRLRQILMNLVGNAIKFTDQGTVRIVARMEPAATSDGPSIQFDVIDTGIGLSGPQMAGLFQPFSQADASTTRRYGGTGLGLALSRRLARTLGGDISVTSQIGGGSTFRVVVPTGPLDGVDMLTDPAPQPTRTTAETPLTPRADELNGHILLAEDSPDSQKLITLFLTRAGASVVLADDGRQAVDKASAESFDLILMDIQMPVLDGYAAARELRRRGYEKPIIALTANAMEGDRKKCVEAGCDDYATKPIDRQKLIDTIKAHLEGRGPATPLSHTTP